MSKSKKKKEMDRRLKNARREAQRERKKNEAILLSVMGSNIPSVTIKGLLTQRVVVQQPKEAVIPENETTRFIKKIANNVWKLRNKMLDEDGNPKSHFDRVYRFVEALDDALKEIDVSIKSHDGETYDTGMAVNVVAWEKREGATREEIIETIKPTIRLGDRLLQWADVIAVTPAMSQPASERDALAQADVHEEPVAPSDATINPENSNKGE